MKTHRAKACICIGLLSTFCLNAETKSITVISLGSACNVAGALRDNNLRTAAYPFDWIVSPFNSLYNALSDDFKYLLKEDSLSIRLSDRYGILDYYGFHFVHDFPVDRPNDSFAKLIGENHVTGGIICDNWKDFLPAVKEKYLKRINRLKSLCLDTNFIYFIRHGDTTQNQAILLRDLLKIKYPFLSFELIILGQSKEIDKQWNLNHIKNCYLNENEPAEWTRLFQSLNLIPNNTEATQHAK